MANDIVITKKARLILQEFKNLQLLQKDMNEKLSDRKKYILDNSDLIEMPKDFEEYVSLLTSKYNEAKQEYDSYALLLNSKYNDEKLAELSSNNLIKKINNRYEITPTGVYQLTKKPIKGETFLATHRYAITTGYAIIATICAIVSFIYAMVKK
ncbi:MAG: hypothetical protein LBB39_00870 [Mycoplasmataceae bacterium]|jgi:hypothetical protein|nr:hypothetical protein [Mycoplasmataceae bacterium]